MKFVLSLIVVLLVGCATPKPIIEYRVVDVPAPPIIVTPERAPDPGTPDGRARVLVEYIEALRQALREAQVALDAYRK